MTALVPREPLWTTPTPPWLAIALVHRHLQLGKGRGVWAAAGCAATVVSVRPCSNQVVPSVPRVMERRGAGARGGSGGYGSAAYESYLQQENDAQINNLAGKVSALKDISIQIGAHIKEDNSLLGDLDNSFDATGGLLGGTMKRLGRLAQSGGGWHMTQLAAFVFFVFLFMWWLTK